MTTWSQRQRDVFTERTDICFDSHQPDSDGFGLDLRELTRAFYRPVVKKGPFDRLGYGGPPTREQIPLILKRDTCRSCETYSLKTASLHSYSELSLY